MGTFCGPFPYITCSVSVFCHFYKHLLTLLWHTSLCSVSYYLLTQSVLRAPKISYPKGRQAWLNLLWVYEYRIMIGKCTRHLQFYTRMNALSFKCFSNYKKNDLYLSFMGGILFKQPCFMLEGWNLGSMRLIWLSGHLHFLRDIGASREVEIL